VALFSRFPLMDSVKSDRGQPRACGGCPETMMV
jgi:hypothetical protein